MTHNQIDFQTLKENQRHNQEMERQGRGVLSETARHNQAFEQETNRSNLVNENVRKASLAETHRSNLVNEAIKGASLEETSRSNLAQESLKHEANVLNYSVGMSNVGESVRHNKAAEFETNRHNVGVENLTSSKNMLDYEVGRTNASANTRNAESNAINASVNQDLVPSQKAKNWGSAVNSFSNAINTGVKTVIDVFSLAPQVAKKFIKGGK